MSVSSLVNSDDDPKRREVVAHMREADERPKIVNAAIRAFLEAPDAVGKSQ
jgi:hypothetical protein